MKKNIRWTIIGLVTILVVAAVACGKQAGQSGPISVPPEVPGQVVYIPFPVKITVDGQLDDWKDVPSCKVDRGPMLSSDPAEDGSFSFAVAADKDNLYVTMQAVDKNIVAGKHGTDFWNEDSLEFYVNTTKTLNTRSYKSGIFQVNINAADIGNTDPDKLTVTGVYSSGIMVHGYVFKTADGWGFEVSVPLNGLIKIAHGTEIGFQAQMNGATTADRDVKLIWSTADTADQSWEYPVLFGRALFFELGQKDIPQPSLMEVLPTATPTPTPFTIPPLVSVNQTGYFPNGQKIALVAASSTDPMDWSLLSGTGETLLSGKTILKGQDAASGDLLQMIDFSSFTTPGSGYQIMVGDLKSVPFNISADIYSKLKDDAMAYFYDNRSGTPIEAKYAGPVWARPAGHLTDSSVTCFKGTDANGKTWPGCDYTLNVAGGWYDAGDFGKYVVNGGISAWTLMNAYESFPDAYPDGTLNIPENANGIPDILDEARWEMEFLLSMQVPEGQPLAGMVHHKMHDEAWAAMPMVPPSEVDNDNANATVGVGRYLYPPSTAATLNLAATAAQCARIWKPIDADFAARCLTAAETAWKAALANPNLYAGNTPGAGGGNYEDSNVTDEFYWAAAELYITTGQDEYKDFLLASPLFGNASAFDWGHTAPLGTISLASAGNDLPEDKAAAVKSSVLAFADKMTGIQDRDGYFVPLDGDYQWGSNGQVLNNMMLTGLAYKLSGDEKYLDAVRLGMDYLLGRNPVNQSYVSGYGAYAMEHPHHRFWANDPANRYPPPPPGVVAGGPNADPTDPVAVEANLSSRPVSKRYLDDIGSYTTNEVTINWNAPLVWAAAFLDGTRDLP